MPTVTVRISVALRFEVEVPREALTIDPDGEYTKQDELMHKAIHEQVTAQRIVDTAKATLDPHAQNMGLESSGECRFVSLYFYNEDNDPELQDTGFVLEDDEEWNPKYVP